MPLGRLQVREVQYRCQPVEATHTKQEIAEADDREKERWWLFRSAPMIQQGKAVWMINPFAEDYYFTLNLPRIPCIV